MSKDYIIIEAGSTKKQYWRDVWRYRELFYILAWRDISVRYKQTIIGVLWVLIQPLLTVIIFTLIFGKLAKLPTDGTTPYALLVYAGLLPWQLFSASLASASASLIGEANLISKIYFPRIIVPAATVIVSFVDFLVSFVILLVMIIWYKFVPGWQIVTLPLFVLMAVFTSFGPGLLFASFNVKYRDFRYIIPFLIQIGLYISPVGYSSSVISGKSRLLYSLNPIVGVIDGFRWAILGGETKFYLPSFLLSLVVITFFTWFGIYKFKRMEKSFADLI